MEKNCKYPTVDELTSLAEYLTERKEKNQVGLTVNELLEKLTEIQRSESEDLKVYVVEEKGIWVQVTGRVLTRIVESKGEKNYGVLIASQCVDVDFPLSSD